MGGRARAIGVELSRQRGCVPGLGARTAEDSRMHEGTRAQHTSKHGSEFGSPPTSTSFV